MPRSSRFSVASFLALILLMPVAANAATVIVFGTNSPSDATATGTITCCGANTLTFSLTNTSPFDARITAVGFDLVAGDFSGNNSSGLNGYTGTSSSASFAFGDGSLGNVPMFNAAVLDFGSSVGNSGNFTGGSPNNGIDQMQTVNFTVTGPFAGFSEAELASALVVRFQRVGEDGKGSDVGRSLNTTAVPEPASMILFGTGLMVLARRKLRRRSDGEVAADVSATA